MAKEYVPYSGPIVTRKQAKTAGLKRYFMGPSRPCKYGHISERKISNGSCTQCMLVGSMDAAKQKSHREQHAIKVARWRRKNPEKAAAIESARRARRDQASKVWGLANPEKRNAYARSYRARSRGSVGVHTADDIKSLYASQRGRCAYCRTRLTKGYHVDHIHPLFKGGSNSPSNLQLTCASCNIRKGRSEPLVFARRIGRLV